jgi:DNA (cytosine-5)-methyltransferase 1
MSVKRKNIKALKPKLTVASLFAGGGGFDLGFKGGFEHLGVAYEKLPYKLVWANDNDIDAQIVYEANQKKYFDKHKFSLGDIRDIKPKEVPDFDILLAGFPCQPFSNAGDRNGINDHRGTLFEEVERFIKWKKPIAFVIENVKGILSSKMSDGTPIPLEIRRRLSKVVCHDKKTIWYNVAQAKVLNSKNFGVPQQRERVIIIGVRSDIAGNSEFQFDDLYANVKKESLHKIKLKNVLKKISPKVPHANEIWEFSPQAANLLPYIHRSWKDIPYDVLPPRFKRIRDNMKHYKSPNFYRRFSLEEVNGTITASAQPENCGIIHPIENRRFSVREIARIQSFPDDFIFPCKTLVSKYKVIGNAVPPVLAFVIAKTLYQYLQDIITTSKHNKDA